MKLPKNQIYSVESNSSFPTTDMQRITSSSNNSTVIPSNKSFETPYHPSQFSNGNISVLSEQQWAQQNNPNSSNTYALNKNEATRSRMPTTLPTLPPVSPQGTTQALPAPPTVSKTAFNTTMGNDNDTKITKDIGEENVELPPNPNTNDDDIETYVEDLYYEDNNIDGYGNTQDIDL